MHKVNFSLLILFFIIFLGGLLRFYKLDWGNGIYAHPDEYHIVSSVNQLQFPNQMNPHFFSYGTVVIYPIYFTKELILSLDKTPDVFLIGRFYSALFSTLTIAVIYLIGRFFLNNKLSLLAALLTALTPGSIQQAHFATPESTLIFFIFSSLLFILFFLKTSKIRFLIFCSICFGFSLGVKISTVIFGFAIFFSMLITSYKNPFRFFVLLTIVLFTSLLTFVLTSPFVFLDNQAFLNNIKYEGNLAAGNISVFYTRQFIETTPIIFHLEKIFPYALGPSILIGGLIGGIISVFIFVKKNNPILFVLFLTFFIFFISNAFLFAKWTRFVSPVFPFFSLFTAFLISYLIKKQRSFGISLCLFIIFTTSIWTVAFFNIYLKPDIRISASNWILENIKEGSAILVEGGNTIDLPLSGNYQKTSLDFYALEDDAIKQQEIANALFETDYFLIQSRRVFYNHQKQPLLFPKTSRLYYLLFSGELGFKQIKEFSSYPSIFSFAIPDENAEETWSVFDHPVIRVFEKTDKLPKETYEKIFQN